MAVAVGDCAPIYRTPASFAGVDDNGDSHSHSLVNDRAMGDDTGRGAVGPCYSTLCPWLAGGAIFGAARSGGGAGLPPSPRPGHSRRLSLGNRIFNDTQIEGVFFGAEVEAGTRECVAARLPLHVKRLHAH